MLADKFYSDNFQYKKEALIVWYPFNVLSTFLQTFFSHLLSLEV